MGVDVKIAGTNYTGVPYITLPLTAGGSVKFCEVSDTTATASDVASGKKFYTASGELTTGTATASGGSSSETYGKTFTVTQKDNQTINISVKDDGLVFANTGDTTTYQLVCPKSFDVTLTANTEYTEGDITINGTTVTSSKDHTDGTVHYVLVTDTIPNNAIISATDAKPTSGTETEADFVNTSLQIVGMGGDSTNGYIFGVKSCSGVPIKDVAVMVSDNGTYVLFLATSSPYKKYTVYALGIDWGEGQVSAGVTYDVSSGTFSIPIYNDLKNYLVDCAENKKEATLTIRRVA
jgi:hypothetical protein